MHWSRFKVISQNGVMDSFAMINASQPHSTEMIGDVFVGSVHTATKAVCTVLVIFVLILGCFGNALVFLSASQFKKLRSNFDVLILNLAMADFLMCSCLSPVFLYVLFVEPPYPRIFCSSFLFLGTACGLLSLLALVAIAIHRQARVVGQTKGSLTPCQVGLILAFVWTLSIVLALGGTLHVAMNWPENQQTCQMIVNSHDKFTYNFLLFFIAPVSIVSFVIISVSYTVIAWAVHKQSRIKRPTAQIHNKSVAKSWDFQRKPQNSCLANSRDAKLKRNSSGKLSATFALQSTLDKENKALTMCLVVTLTIILCWGPLISSQFVELLTGESIILYQVKICGIALVFLNSALDPYIYAQYSSKMKQKCVIFFKNLVKCKCRRKGTRTVLRSNGAIISLDANKNKSSHYEQETNTVHLASPKHHRKIVIDRSVGPTVFSGHRTLILNNQLLYTCAPQSSHSVVEGKVKMADHGYNLPVKKCNQVNDANCLVKDPRHMWKNAFCPSQTSLIKHSCCHIPDKEMYSLMET